jgi:hypothetical protein
MDFWHWRFARLVLHSEIVAHSDQLGVAFPPFPEDAPEICAAAGSDGSASAIAIAVFIVALRYFSPMRTRLALRSYSQTILACILARY